MELGMQSRAIVDRREEWPTAPGRSGVDHAEVRVGKEALVEAWARFAMQGGERRATSKFAAG